MKDGVVQQIDSPQNLYDHPYNKFVAGFMGSPQMNILNAKCGKDGNQVTLTFGGGTIKLDKEKSAMLENYVGKEVSFGIRPEDVHDDPAFIAENPDMVINATIRVYEMLGAEVYLYFDIDDTNVTARVKPDTTARPGSQVKFALDIKKIHVFDNETELTIF